MNRDTISLLTRWLGTNSRQAKFWLAIVYACSVTHGGTAISAEPRKQPKHVLILYAVNTNLPVHLDWEHGIRSALQAGSEPLEVDVEFADLLRFEDPVYVEKLIGRARRPTGRTDPATRRCDNLTLTFNQKDFIMSEQSSVVGVYATLETAEAAVKKLRGHPRSVQNAGNFV